MSNNDQQKTIDAIRLGLALIGELSRVYERYREAAKARGLDLDRLLASDAAENERSLYDVLGIAEPLPDQPPPPPSTSVFAYWPGVRMTDPKDTELAIGDRVFTQPVSGLWTVWSPELGRPLPKEPWVLSRVVG